MRYSDCEADDSNKSAFDEFEELIMKFESEWEGKIMETKIALEPAKKKKNKKKNRKKKTDSESI